MLVIIYLIICFFFFNDTATTEIYTLSLHDALPIYARWLGPRVSSPGRSCPYESYPERGVAMLWRCLYQNSGRSEEHTSELQSRQYFVCRLLLEKKKKKNNILTVYVY